VHIIFIFQFSRRFLKTICILGNLFHAIFGNITALLEQIHWNLECIRPKLDQKTQGRRGVALFSLIDRDSSREKGDKGRKEKEAGTVFS
jgi:hypothetical protein